MVKRMRGFTLLELLVVLAIIGVLLALLIPAVQAARERARRVSCRNQLHQLGLAMQTYHDAHGALPINYGVGPYNESNRGASWISQVLPQLGETALYGTLRFGEALTAPENDAASRRPIATLLCPSDVHGNGVMPNRRESHDPRAVTNYKACLGSNWAWGTFAGSISESGRNAGKTDGLEDCNGVLCRGGDKPPPTTRFGDITDGASNTFQLGEAVPEWCWHTWWYWFNASTGTCAIPINHFQQPEDTLDDWFENYGFASRHSGGAHFSFNDGRVVFVSDNIDRTLYRQLATISGGEVVVAPE